MCLNEGILNFEGRSIVKSRFSYGIFVLDFLFYGHFCEKLLFFN